MYELLTARGVAGRSRVAIAGKRRAWEARGMKLLSAPRREGGRVGLSPGEEMPLRIWRPEVESQSRSER